MPPRTKESFVRRQKEIARQQKQHEKEQEKRAKKEKRASQPTAAGGSKGDLSPDELSSLEEIVGPLAAEGEAADEDAGDDERPQG